MLPRTEECSTVIMNYSPPSLGLNVGRLTVFLSLALTLLFAAPAWAGKPGTKPTTTVPAAPSGLTATAASSSQINLSWTDNA